MNADPTDRVAAAWRQIETHTAAIDPAVAASLRGSATSATIRDVEARIGHALPADVRASLALHDGQPLGAASIAAPWQLLALADAIAAWNADGWPRALLPLATDEAGNFLALDLADPAKPLLAVRHDAPDRPTVASNWLAWLERLAADWAGRVASATVGTGTPSGDAGPPTMAQLLALVGKPPADPDVRRFLATQPIEREPEEDGGFYLSCVPHGYGITCAPTAVEYVEVRLSERLDGGVFRGPLVAGVLPSDGRAELEQKLGPPIASAGFRTAMNPTGWVRYEIDGHPVTFAYRADYAGLSLIHLGR